MNNKEPNLLLFQGKKRKFLRINLQVEIFLFACVFLKQKYIFPHTFDLCGRVGGKKCFTRPISGNKTTFFSLEDLFFFKILKNLTTSAFFFPRQILKNIRYASAKASNAALVKLTDWILKMNWNFLLKRYNFLQLQNFAYTPPQAATQEKCLLMRQKS